MLSKTEWLDCKMNVCKKLFDDIRRRRTSKPRSTSSALLQSVRDLVRPNEGMSCISVSVIRIFSDGYAHPDSSTHQYRSHYQSWDSLGSRTSLFNRVASLVSLVRGLQDNGAPHGAFLGPRAYWSWTYRSHRCSLVGLYIRVAFDKLDSVSLFSSIRFSRLKRSNTLSSSRAKATMGATTNNSDEKPDVMMVEKAINDDVEGNPVKAPQVHHFEGFNVLGLSAEDAEFWQNYSAAERKKTMHKVSIRPHTQIRYRTFD